MQKSVIMILVMAAMLSMSACSEKDSDSSKVQKEKTTVAAAESSSAESKAETTTTAEPEKEESFLPANEEQIKKDLQDNLELVEKAKLTINSVTIDKRMTTEETKEDIVYITAEFTGPMCKGSVTGQAKYLLFNEGWGYDSFTEEEVASEPTRDLTEEDMRKVFDDVLVPTVEGETSYEEINSQLEETGDNHYIWSFNRNVTVKPDWADEYFTSQYLETVDIVWNQTDCLWHMISTSTYADPNAKTTVVEYKSNDGTGGITSPDLVEFSK